MLFYVFSNVILSFKKAQKSPVYPELAHVPEYMEGYVMLFGVSTFRCGTGSS